MSTLGLKITVVIADSQPIYREGLARGLTLSGQIQVLADTPNGREALEAIRIHKPDVAVVDYNLPDIDGLSVVHAMARDGIPTKGIILSETSDSDIMHRPLTEIASGYLSKDSTRAEIVNAVLRVAKNKRVTPSELRNNFGKKGLRRTGCDVTLTEREQQILNGFARGLSIPKLAGELFIAASTVKTHTQRLYEKLGVSDRAAAVAEAMRRGLFKY